MFTLPHKPLGIEKAREIFKENGLVLLENNYISVKKKMKCICICSKERYLSLESVRRGRKCLECGRAATKEKQKLSFTEVKIIFTKEGCELLEEGYNNNHAPMRYRCSCGNVSEISLAHFKNGRRCRDCGVKKSSDAKRLDSDFVSKYFENEGYLLLEGYVESGKKMLCKCPNDHIIEIDWEHFKHGYRCKQCYYDRNRGENHPNWNPELSDEDRERLRRIDGIDRWRTEVFERDNYTCRNCGNLGNKLNAHHIFNYADNKDMRVDINNGITLCEDCHRDFHKEYGYRNNDNNQLQQFLIKGAN